MIHEFKNDALQKVVSIPMVYGEPVTGTYRKFLAEVGEGNAMSPSSFRRLITDPDVTLVKGWRYAMVNAAAAAAAATERRVQQRAERRDTRKKHKKAEKAAKRNLANGNRNRLGAQERAKQKKDTGNVFRPSVTASLIAQAIHK